VRLVSEVSISGELGRWQVYVRYGERRYKLGTWLLSPDAHCACSARATEKALGSPEKRAKREVADGVL
jgi:hypothetical protein